MTIVGSGLIMNYKKLLVGFATADAMGVPVEGFPREKLRNDPVTNMREFGSWNQPAGTWSDDTTMTIATMESITRLKKINYDDIMRNFVKWYKNGEFTVSGLFDIGITTSQAVSNFIHGTPAVECGGKDIHSNGNGSLMRMVPIALYLHRHYSNNFDTEAMKVIHKMSALTHGHPISQMCCGFYCLIAAELLENKPITTAVTDGLSKGANFYKKIPKVAVAVDKYFGRLLDEKFINLPEIAIESSGYVLHSLEAAIWCLLNTNDYRSLILKAVNLGRDTDTIGAIASGLGGLVYSFEDLPMEWISKLRKKEYLEKIENAFLNSLN